MAGSLSLQDEPTPPLRSCPLGIACGVTQEKISPPTKLIPFNKYFIDQACSVTMAGYWPQYMFLCVYGPRLHLPP